VRGGVIDVYTPLAPHPVRIELFGDEIDSLRWFEAESQRTLRPVDWVHLHPVRETINTGTRDVRTRLREYADEIAFPSKATRRLIEQIERRAPKAASTRGARATRRRPAACSSHRGPDPGVPRRAGRARGVHRRAGRSSALAGVDPEACRRTVDDAWADAEGRYAESRAPSS